MLKITEISVVKRTLQKLMSMRTYVLNHAQLVLSGLKNDVLFYQNDFTIRCISVGSATALSDWVWANYMLGVTSRMALEASLWASAVIILGAFVVLSYVDDKRLIIPAAIGAFIGTYLAL